MAQQLPGIGIRYGFCVRFRFRFRHSFVKQELRWLMRLPSTLLRVLTVTRATPTPRIPVLRKYRTKLGVQAELEPQPRETHLTPLRDRHGCCGIGASGALQYVEENCSAFPYSRPSSIGMSMVRNGPATAWRFQMRSATPSIPLSS